MTQTTVAWVLSGTDDRWPQPSASPVVRGSPGGRTRIPCSGTARFALQLAPSACVQNAIAEEHRAPSCAARFAPRLFRRDLRERARSRRLDWPAVPSHSHPRARCVRGQATGAQLPDEVATPWAHVPCRLATHWRACLESRRKMRGAAKRARAGGRPECSSTTRPTARLHAAPAVRGHICVHSAVSRAPPASGTRPGKPPPPGYEALKSAEPHWHPPRPPLRDAGTDRTAAARTTRRRAAVGLAVRLACCPSWPRRPEQPGARDY